MFYSRSTNIIINNLQERALRLVNDDYILTFDELLEKDGSFTIHHYNIQMLCIELYKVYRHLSQTIFSELFTRNNSTYNMQSKSDFVIPQVSTVFKGYSSVSYYGPIIWSLVPEKIRYTDSLESFKSKISTGMPKNCRCRICKNYILNVGFLETLIQHFQEERSFIYNI